MSSGPASRSGHSSHPRHQGLLAPGWAASASCSFPLSCQNALGVSFDKRFKNWTALASLSRLAFISGLVEEKGLALDLDTLLLTALQVADPLLGRRQFLRRRSALLQDHTTHCFPHIMM